ALTSQAPAVSAFRRTEVRLKPDTTSAISAAVVLFVAELSLAAPSMASGSAPLAALAIVHAINVSLILAIAWRERWPVVGPVAVVPGWVAAMVWHLVHPEASGWTGVLALAGAFYVVGSAYPFVLHRRARNSREPYLTAVAASGFFFVAARTAFLQGGLNDVI